jgi:hypothetical protein
MRKTLGVRGGAVRPGVHLRAGWRGLAGLRDFDRWPAIPVPDPRFAVPAVLACVTLFGGGVALGTVAGRPRATPVTELQTIRVTRTVQHTAAQRPARPAPSRVARELPASTLERTVQVAVQVPVVQTRIQTVRETTTVQLPPVTSTVTATVTTGTTFP